MFYQLPPVGNPVLLHGVEPLKDSFNATFAPYDCRFYASGTAALAAAIIAAARFKDVEHPEVILPAYCCPDLVSAIVFAGARPVLVDMELDRPWLDLDRLDEKLGEQTVAIVAVDLFGISERFDVLRKLADKVGAVLIEDSAQYFPGSGESNIWQGDLVVLSFGRGKPVSLLGGGAVLFQGESPGEWLPVGHEQQEPDWRERAVYRFKVMLYNNMISPRLYWIPQGLPFLHLGETHYNPLTKINAIGHQRLTLLPSNISVYQSILESVHKKLSSLLDELALTEDFLIDLPKVCKTPLTRRLLRYPLLVDQERRDDLYQALKRHGLGPSKMYPAAMPAIAGLEKILAGQGRFPGAESFSARILTLPTHLGVHRKDLDKIQNIMSIFQNEMSLK